MLDKDLILCCAKEREKANEVYYKTLEIGILTVREEVWGCNFAFFYILSNGKRCLEVMAGKGYLSACLRQLGVDIKATDLIPSGWVEGLCALESLKKYKDTEVIIMSWVEYKNPIGYEVLKLKRKINPKAKIILIGEGFSGCCGTDSLFEKMEVIDDINFKEVQENYTSWRGIHDTIQIIK